MFKDSYGGFEIDLQSGWSWLETTKINDGSVNMCSSRVVNTIGLSCMGTCANKVWWHMEDWIGCTTPSSSFFMLAVSFTIPYERRSDCWKLWLSLSFSYGLLMSNILFATTRFIVCYCCDNIFFIRYEGDNSEEWPWFLLAWMSLEAAGLFWV